MMSAPRRSNFSGFFVTYEDIACQGLKAIRSFVYMRDFSIMEYQFGPLVELFKIKRYALDQSGNESSGSSVDSVAPTYRSWKPFVYVCSDKKESEPKICYRNTDWIFTLMFSCYPVIALTSRPNGPVSRTYSSKDVLLDGYKIVMLRFETPQELDFSETGVPWQVVPIDRRPRAEVSVVSRQQETHQHQPAPFSERRNQQQTSTPNSKPTVIGASNAFTRLPSRDEGEFGSFAREQSSVSELARSTGNERFDQCMGLSREESNSKYDSDVVSKMSETTLLDETVIDSLVFDELELVEAYNATNGQPVKLDEFMDKVRRLDVKSDNVLECVSEREKRSVKIDECPIMFARRVSRKRCFFIDETLVLPRPASFDLFRHNTVTYVVLGASG